MSRVAILALCVLATLVQTALSQQCGCGQIPYGSRGLGGIERISVSAPSISLSKSSSAAPYGGLGTGQVGVSGDIGAYGETVVVGSVPVLGAVEFGGIVPACGSVSISGQCGCGCN